MKGQNTINCDAVVLYRRKRKTYSVVNVFDKTTWYSSLLHPATALADA